MVEVIKFINLFLFVPRHGRSQVLFFSVKESFGVYDNEEYIVLENKLNQCEITKLNHLHNVANVKQ